jgi:hypothetical protein
MITAVVTLWRMMAEAKELLLRSSDMRAGSEHMHELLLRYVTEGMRSYLQDVHDSWRQLYL